MAQPNLISAAQRLAEDGLTPDYLSTQRSDPQQITFTRQQLAALETVFPEIAVGSDAMPDAKVRHHLGQRSVVAFVRSKVR